MKPNKVALDFDGVLTVGGEGLKQEAWEVMSLALDEEIVITLNRMRDYFSEGRGSRCDILRETFKTVSMSDEERSLLTNAYASCYNTLVQEMLLASGMPEGTVKVLEELRRLCPLYVNSATPEEAVQESLKRLGIAQFFTGVFGQPAGKVENLRRIAGAYKDDLVFVGDGVGDLRAAKVFGCRFIGIANEWNNWDKPQPELGSFLVVPSIREVPAAIAAL